MCGQLHPENYGFHQLIDAIQSGQNVSALEALGSTHYAIFSYVDLPLQKGEANYNQWAFDVQSLQPYYQEEVLWEGMIQLFKGVT